MRLYLEIARRGYRRYAAYPAATWAGLFTNTVFGFMLAYILLALYREREVLGGYDATDAVTYVWLTQGLVATIFMWGWFELSLRIRTGDIAVDLSRPVDPLRYGLAFDLGRSLYHALFRGIPPFLLGALVFDLRLPTGLVTPIAFAVSVVLAVAVSYAFRFLYNLPAFWLLDYRGVGILAIVVASLFSGFVIPIAYFPDWLATIANVTPFPAMVRTPVEIFIGQTEGLAVLRALAGQLFWMAALLALGRLVLSAGTRRLVIQGG